MLLLTNDDGINAPGLAAMHNALADLDDIIVVAPDMEQSGVAHSITLHVPLRVRKVHRNGRLFGYAVNGSPADCVKLAMCELLQDKPSAVISGINYGANTGVSVLYSGTVAAAIEGAFFGITSIAVSLEWDDHADYDRAAGIGATVIRQLLDRRPVAGSLFNLNIPTRALAGGAELRVVPMSVARYGEAFERRVDPRGRSYWWATNEPPPPPSPGESDVTALAAGHVTLTPLDYDLTHRGGLAELAAGPWRLG